MRHGWCWLAVTAAAWIVVGCAGENDFAGGAAPLPFCAPGQTAQCQCGNGSDPALGCAPMPGMMGPADPGGAAGTTPAISGAAGSAGSIPSAGGSGGAAGTTPGADSGTGGSGQMAGAGGAAGTPSMAGSGDAGASGSAGTSGMAGSGMAGSGGGGSGSGGSGGSEPIDPSSCGDGGWTGKASNAGASGTVRGSGSVGVTLPLGNRFTRLQTTLEVPAKPPESGTVFLWPGLEPLRGDENYNPIGLGVLQPVLTWGPSCAAQAPRDPYEEWWIAGMYVNVSGSSREHRGCIDGDVMQVAVDDLLDIDVALDDTTWTQTISAQTGMKTVDFAIDLEGQPQRWALFEIELPGSNRPTEDVVFTDTVLTFAEPAEERCQPNSRGTSDYFSQPVASADGLRCCYARIVLRAAGVRATTVDPAP